MNTSYRFTRRQFLKTTATIAAAAPTILPARVWAAQKKPNDRITLGFIGMGKQNRGLLNGFIRNKQTQVVAVCEVDATRREHAKKMVADRLRKLKKQAVADADSIKALVVTIKAKAGEEGKLFGSVTTMDIAETAKAQGVIIDKRKIVLEEPIKRLGDYTVTVKLHADITAAFKVSVVAEE